MCNNLYMCAFKCVCVCVCVLAVTHHNLIEAYQAAAGASSRCCISDVSEYLCPPHAQRQKPAADTPLADRQTGHRHRKELK